MEKLISDNLNSALCFQLNHEKYNANLYLFIAGFLKNKGFNRIGKHFLDQHSEETSHSLMIFDLLTDLNSPVNISEIDEINLTINNIMDIATTYLEREITTTQSLDAIKKLAIDEENPIVEEKMREMLKIQQSEYAEATDFMDKAQLTGNDWKFVMLWDLGENV